MSEANRHVYNQKAQADMQRYQKEKRRYTEAKAAKSIKFLQKINDQEPE